MAKKPPPAPPMPDDAGPAAGSDPFTHIGDEHWGRGGRYVVDADGRRVPVIPESEVAAREFQSTGTGEPTVPVAGDTLTAPPTPEN